MVVLTSSRLIRVADKSTRVAAMTSRGVPVCWISHTFLIADLRTSGGIGQACAKARATSLASRRVASGFETSPLPP